MRVVTAAGPQHDYTREYVRRVLKVSERQLRGWEKQGLIGGGQVFSFPDIVALRTLCLLRERHVSPKTIAQAVLSLRRKLKDVERPLSELKIRANGRKLSVQLQGGEMDALTGQLLLNFEGPSSSAPTAFPRQNSLRARDSEAHFQHGLLLEETGAPRDEAVSAYTRAIELNPEAAGALVNLATIYFRDGKLAEAEDLYNQAIAADPHYALAHFNLGNLYDEQGRSEQARDRYREATRLNPRYADAYFNLALVSERMGDTLQAVSFWKQYLRLDPSSEWAETARKQLDRLTALTVIRPR